MISQESEKICRKGCPRAFKGMTQTHRLAPIACLILLGACDGSTSVEDQSSAAVNDVLLASRAATPNQPTGDAPLPLTATANAAPVICPQDARDAKEIYLTCGTVSVPLDREKPTGAKVKIYFELYRRKSLPAASAIVPNPGGPGESTSGLRTMWLGSFAANLDDHDLLLIDDRGRGRSEALDCKSLQDATAPSLDVALSECAHTLGGRLSDYGSGDNAYDVEAVRAAVGYQKIDYYGGSYGGLDAIAYAGRFPQHLRSVVLDSAQGPSGLGKFAQEGFTASTAVQKVQLVCQRSPSCIGDHPNPAADFKRLVGTLQTHPFSRKLRGADGAEHVVTVDESLILNVVENGSVSGFTGTGELLAAGAALDRGDEVPLLRLATEASDILQPSGAATDLSAASRYATICADHEMPFDWSTSPAERLTQLTTAANRLPAGMFGAFSASAATSLRTNSAARSCVSWARSKSPTAVLPAKVRFSQIPTLLLASDIDALAPVEMVSADAARYPASQLVVIPEAGHLPGISTQCGLGLIGAFIAGLAPGDTRCASQPEIFFPAVGRFPLHASDARPADVASTGTGQIGIAERKVVSVVVATVVDALQRGGVNQGNGLRGGTFEIAADATGNRLQDADGNWTVTLTNARFASDVIVNGQIKWNGSSGAVDAQVSVTGDGTAGGQIRILGSFEAPGPVGRYTISGSLGGRKVTAEVSEV